MTTLAFVDASKVPIYMSHVGLNRSRDGWALQSQRGSGAASCVDSAAAPVTWSHGRDAAFAAAIAVASAASPMSRPGLLERRRHTWLTHKQGTFAALDERHVTAQALNSSVVATRDVIGRLWSGIFDLQN